MSGGSISYNIRPNKYVERHLFSELLSYLCAGTSPDASVYISLGGPQLEDHKLLHQVLNFRNLISLEEDEAVYSRQLFNLRPSFVKCLNTAVETFVTDLPRWITEYEGKRLIIWFDYASPRERLSQLSEYQATLRQLVPGDILKITLNANPDTLRERLRGRKFEDVLDERHSALKSQTPEALFGTGITPTDMSGNKLARVLCEIVERASIEALSTTALYEAVPVALFTYQDSSHIMLTITICLSLLANTTKFRESLSNSGWEYLPSSWRDVTSINVPNLTAKERLYLEKYLLTKSNSDIHRDMGFRLDSDEDTSLLMIEEYAKHYRRYPSYFQVIL